MGVPWGRHIGQVLLRSTGVVGQMVVAVTTCDKAIPGWLTVCCQVIERMRFGFLPPRQAYREGLQVTSNDQIHAISGQQLVMSTRQDISLERTDRTFFSSSITCQQNVQPTAYQSFLSLTWSAGYSWWPGTTLRSFGRRPRESWRARLTLNARKSLETCFPLETGGSERSWWSR